MEEVSNVARQFSGRPFKVEHEHPYRPEIFGLIRERGGVVLPHEMSNSAGRVTEYGFPVGMPFPAHILALHKGEFVECKVDMVMGHLEVLLPTGGVVHMSAAKEDRMDYLGSDSLMGSRIQLVHLEMGMTEKLALQEDFFLMGASQPEPIKRPKLKF